MADRLQYHFDSAPPVDRGTMKGFDEEFVDIVDYIERITYRIWEGKQVGLCFDYYSEDCPVYTLSGITIGNAEVTQNTLNTLAAFPDRTLHADNIIWGGNEETGFHTSHLITTSMTNLGASDLGPATGAKATFQVIAHCIVKNNRIIEEWLVRDNYSLAEQLGFDPHEIASDKAKSERQPRFDEWYQREIERVIKTVDHDRYIITERANETPEKFVLSNLQNIWNARLLGDVIQAYSNNAKLYASANRDAQGHDEIIKYYTKFLGTFSNLKISFDYCCSIPNSVRGTDVAVRWTMAGIHTGSVLYGPPTEAPILILGESHFQVLDGKIVEERTVFDELSVLVEIYRARTHRP